MTIKLHKLERKLQSPSVTTTTEDSGIHTATTCKYSCIAADLDVHLLVLC